jgi:hypothetical protein
VTEIEITTANERLAAALAPTAGPEPTLTLGQVESLLRAATAYAEAQRPVVLHQAAPMPAPAVTVLPTAAGYGPPPQHPGIDIDTRVQTPSVGWAVIRHRVPQAPGWGVRLALASMLVSLAGGASAGATDGNAAAVAACTLGIVGAITGTARAVHEQNREQ